jgi:L-ascorbate metabolism protein UlaG (beta-lactamase superfamily)
MLELTAARHATLLLDYDTGPAVLVDPMLGEPGAAPPVEDTLPRRRNPLVPLGVPAAELLDRADAVLVTHLHADHFDGAAQADVPRDVSFLCAPADRETLAGHGFTALQAIDEALEHGGLEMVRVAARHTLDHDLEEALGAGSGYVLRASGAPVVYVMGDCVWCPEAARTIDRLAPDVIVANAGAARFTQGGHITMTSEDVIALARHAPNATVVAVHMEAINHCAMTRDELRRHATAAGVGTRVRIPADGEVLPF